MCLMDLNLWTTTFSSIFWVQFHASTDALSIIWLFQFCLFQISSSFLYDHFAFLPPPSLPNLCLIHQKWPSFQVVQFANSDSISASKFLVVSDFMPLFND